MKFRKPLFAALAITALLSAGAVLAQTQPATTPPPEQSSATPPAASNSTTFDTKQGQVTINSTMGTAPTTGPAPSFATLSGGSKWITPEQAAAYPPLANDFLHASRDGKRISKAQYEQWVKQLQ